MSGALDIVRLYQAAAKGSADDPFNWEDSFGNPSELEGSDRDLFTLFERDRKNGLLPELYQACGTKDFLYEMNRDVHRRLTEQGAEIVYHEVPEHMHNWDFWDLEIRRILDWMLPTA